MKHIRMLSMDEVLISQLTSAFLRRKGYEMLPAAHEGAELLELLLRERTDIVVIDLALPVLDGLDVLEVASALPCRSGRCCSPLRTSAVRACLSLPSAR